MASGLGFAARSAVGDDEVATGQREQVDRHRVEAGREAVAAEGPPQRVAHVVGKLACDDDVVVMAFCSRLCPRQQ